MKKSKSLLWLSVGKKTILALAGLGLLLFIVVHLLGNLLLLSNSSTSFNTYAHTLHSLGKIILAVELGLLAILLIHAVLGVIVTVTNKGQRPIPYHKKASAGRTSKMTFSSKTMIYSGIILLIFMVIHVKSMLFSEYFMTELHGNPARDLYKTVLVYFTNPIWVTIYCAVMIILGFHLRHGIWSVFQSLGLSKSTTLENLYKAALILSILIAGGFFIIPIVIFITGGVQ